MPATPPPRRSRGRPPRAGASAAGSGAASSASAARAGSAGSPTTSIAPGAAGCTERSSSRGSTAPLYSLTSSANVASTGSSPGTLERLKATARARWPPASTEKRTWRPSSPIVRWSASRAAGTSSDTSGLPMPNGARRASSSASSRPSSSPATTASTRSPGVRSSPSSARSACATNAARNASTSSRRTVQPAAARWPPWRMRWPAAASSPPSRSKAGIERPEPVPCSPSRATSTHGRLACSAMREATMPITPGCQSSAAST